MIDWILNPYGIDLGAYLILWAALLIMIPVALVVGIVQTVRQRRREPGNGSSGRDGDRA
jgi:hypothetical protein